MAKRRATIGKRKKSRSHKTKKRLAIKREMLAKARLAHPFRAKKASKRRK